MKRGAFGTSLPVQNAVIMTSDITVILEDFAESHIDKTFEWVSDPDLQKDFLIRKKPTRESHLEYFKNVLGDATQQVFAISAKGAHVGNCGLKNISDKSAELWIYIGEERYRKRGFGREATSLLLRKGFEVLGLKQIYVHVVEFNTNARRLYEQLGFKETSLSHDSKTWEGRGCNIIRMELERK